MIVLTVPLDDPSVKHIMEKWTAEDREAAILDAMLYGNVYVKRGHYVPAKEFHKP